MDTFACSVATVLVLVGNPGRLGHQALPSLSVAWERGGILRLTEGSRVSRVNLSQDIVGCLGQMYDSSTGERFGVGEGTNRILDVATSQGRRFVLLGAIAAANCNVQGQCGAAGPNVTVIWLEIAADLSVVKRQTFAVVDCRASRWIDGAADDWADRVALAGGSLLIGFTELAGSNNVTGTVRYDRKTASLGLEISRSKSPRMSAGPSQRETDLVAEGDVAPLNDEAIQRQLPSKRRKISRVICLS